MKKYIILLLLNIFQLNAQDFHFSQFYAAPLATNPALTGMFDGFMRLGANYRTQWSNINNGSYLYQTPSVYTDANLFDNNIALGMVVLNDQTNNKIYNTLEGGLSFAYKVKFKKMIISLGIQGWYFHRYLDYSRLNNSYIQSTAIFTNSIDNFDFNSGIFANYKLNKDITLFCGSSVSHLLHSSDQFSDNSSDRTIPLKYVFHGGSNIDLNSTISLIPGLFYSNQALASQLNIGNIVSYKLSTINENGDIILFAGMWARINEFRVQSLIPKVGLEFNKIRYIASYDYTINSLNNEVYIANKSVPNTFEISIVYMISMPKRSSDFGCYF